MVSSFTSGASAAQLPSSPHLLPSTDLYSAASSLTHHPSTQAKLRFNIDDEDSSSDGEEEGKGVGSEVNVPLYYSESQDHEQVSIRRSRRERGLQDSFLPMALPMQSLQAHGAGAAPRFTRPAEPRHALHHLRITAFEEDDDEEEEEQQARDRDFGRGRARAEGNKHASPGPHSPLAHLHISIDEQEGEDENENEDRRQPSSPAAVLALLLDTTDSSLEDSSLPQDALPTRPTLAVALESVASDEDDEDGELINASRTSSDSSTTTASAPVEPAPIRQIPSSRGSSGRGSSLRLLGVSVRMPGLWRDSVASSAAAFAPQNPAAAMPLQLDASDSEGEGESVSITAVAPARLKAPTTSPLTPHRVAPAKAKAANAAPEDKDPLPRNFRTHPLRHLQVALESALSDDENDRGVGGDRGPGGEGERQSDDILSASPTSSSSGSTSTGGGSSYLHRPLFRQSPLKRPQGAGFFRESDKLLEQKIAAAAASAAASQVQSFSGLPPSPSLLLALFPGDSGPEDGESVSLGSFPAPSASSSVSKVPRLDRLGVSLDDNDDATTNSGSTGTRRRRNGRDTAQGLSIVLCASDGEPPLGPFSATAEQQKRALHVTLDDDEE